MNYCQLFLLAVLTSAKLKLNTKKYNNLYCEVRSIFKAGLIYLMSRNISKPLPYIFLESRAMRK